MFFRQHAAANATLSYFFGCAGHQKAVAVDVVAGLAGIAPPVETELAAPIHEVERERGDCQVVDHAQRIGVLQGEDH